MQLFLHSKTSAVQPNFKSKINKTAAGNMYSLSMHLIINHLHLFRVSYSES